MSFWTEEKIEKLKELYLTTKYKDVAEILGTTEAAIHHKVQRLKLKYKNDWSDDEINILAENYCKLSLEELSKVLNKGHKSIYNKIKTLKLGKKKRIGHFLYTCKSDYFKTWSPNMAFIVGFIMADGYLVERDNALACKLHTSDIDILEFIKKELEFTGQILTYKYYTPSGKESSSSVITIRNKEIYDDMISFGIIPRKTGHEIIPANMPEEYFYDFLRGMHAGDGHVGFCERTKQARFNIVSQNKQFLVEIKNKTGLGSVVKKDGIFSWYIGSKTQLRILFDKMFHDDSFYMKRKYEKYKYIIDMIDSGELSCYLRDKLSMDIARDIRFLHKSKMPVKEIHALYSFVGIDAINKVIYNQRWKE